MAWTTAAAAAPSNSMGEARISAPGEKQRRGGSERGIFSQAYGMEMDEMMTPIQLYLDTC